MDSRDLRRAYVEMLRARVPAAAESVLQAFERVRREDFLGPAPWQVFEKGRVDAVRTSDLRSIYSGLRVALDCNKGINNGDPVFWAELLSTLGIQRGSRLIQVGAGTGYYTAILAEMVGTPGSVVAWEADAALRESARTSLAPLPNVTVNGKLEEDAPLGEFDALVAFAGVSFIPSSWVRGLRDGGAALIPLVFKLGPNPGEHNGAGQVLLVKRVVSTYVAEFVSPVLVVLAENFRNAKTERDLMRVQVEDRWDRYRRLVSLPDASDDSQVQIGHDLYLGSGQNGGEHDRSAAKHD